MQFLPQKTMKGQAVVDFSAWHPDPRATKLYKDLPDEVDEVCLIQTSFEEQVWQLFFDGASPRGNIVARVGVVLVSPQNYVIPYAFSLTEMCSNNVVEYNNILIECKSPMRLVLKISKRMVIQSSSSIRFAGSTEVRHEDLVPYHNATICMVKRFKNFYIDHVPRH